MKPHTLPLDSLAFALTQSAQVLTGVGAGQSLTEALQRLPDAPWPAATKGAVQDISYTTLRQYGLAKALVALLVPRPPNPLVHGLLSASLALLVEQRYAPHTLVDQAVQAAGAQPKLAGAKNLVNAVLRRFLREQDALLRQARQQDEALWNYPTWWIAAVREHYPAHWQEILRTGNQRPPLTLRVNRRWGTPAQYLEQLQQAGLEAVLLEGGALRLAQAVPVSQLPGFTRGWVSVQDAGAQLAAALLDVHDGMRVLDACAAPGGKTAHILELAAADVLALDQDARRLQRVEENLQRLQLHGQVQVQVKAGDAGQPQDWWEGRPFDRILADVPCSAAGIVRRHPDIRWLRRPADVRSLPQQQQRILTALWPLLAGDGKLLYATCSIFPQEGEAVIQRFLAAHADAIRLPAPGQLLPLAQENEDHDGFYYALLQKKIQKKK